MKGTGTEYTNSMSVVETKTRRAKRHGQKGSDPWLPKGFCPTSFFTHRPNQPSGCPFVQCRHTTFSLWSWLILNFASHKRIKRESLCTDITNFAARWNLKGRISSSVSFCCLAGSGHHNCSWAPFVLLVWSCIIRWLVTRGVHALRSSPFLPAYGNILLVPSFFAGLNTSPEECFPRITQSVLISFGFRPQGLPSTIIGTKRNSMFPHSLPRWPSLSEKSKTVFSFWCCIVLSLNLKHEEWCEGQTRITWQRHSWNPCSLACSLSASEGRPHAKSNSCY